jgi:PAS domain S-box-containing protein
VTDLSIREHVDYAFDNTIAMVFVFVVSYILITIYSKILNSLKRFRLFLSNIIDSMPSIIIGINKDYQIVMWNKEAVKINGLSRNQVSHQFLFDILPQLGEYKQSIKRVIEMNTTSKYHKKQFPYQKKELIVDIAIYPLSHEESGGAVIRIDDISERIKMEEVVVQSEKMLSVGGLAAGMAHELNNPLGGMMQSAQVITNRLTQNLPANDKAANDVGSTMKDINKFMEKRGVLNQLNNITQAGKKAAHIVNNMLSFARKSDSSKEEANMNELKMQSSLLKAITI